jgi:DNA-binding NarL/FixJ family response regulator
VQSTHKIKWEKGRLIVEIQTTIRVPIEIEPITRSALSEIKLTPREQEVLIELLKGRSNKEIGNAVNLSERTVKFHVSSLLQKFGVRGRIEIAMLFPNGLKAAP